uniref:RNA helicase n=1 Tax=Echinostoma caproni TaxID=27848 RepID=A0A183B196_9TREM
LCVLAIYGGVPLGPQCRALRKGTDIVVGTPGRVIDLMEKSVLNLSNLGHVVLDEVDRMLDMGFSKDVESILSGLYSEGNEKPQTLLFSATMPAWVSSVAKSYLSKDAVHLSLIQGQENKTSNNVTHLALPCPYVERGSTLADVIRAYCPNKNSRCIIFCERKNDADELAAHASMSTDCHVFHGGISQDKRELILQKFREGKYRTLITTNVAARGLDIQEVDLVVQCHPPRDVEDYIHRSGRTGRADRTGTSIVFYTPQERGLLSVIERKADIEFRRIGPPTLQDILNSWGNELTKSFLAVPESTWSAFLPTAQSMVRLFRSGKKICSSGDSELDGQSTPDKVNGTKAASVKPVLRALCCALAKLSGKDGAIESRSVLDSRPGMTSYRLDLSEPAMRKGEAYNTLRQRLPDTVVDQLRNVMFIKGRQGFVFDVPSELDSEIASLWDNAENNAQLSLLHEVPELEETNNGDGYSNGYSSPSGGWRGGGGGRGGSRWNSGRGFSRGNGGGGGGQGRGRGFGPRQSNGGNGLSFKRAFSQSGNSSVPEKRFRSTDGSLSSRGALVMGGVRTVFGD